MEKRWIQRIQLPVHCARVSCLHRQPRGTIQLGPVSQCAQQSRASSQELWAIIRTTTTAMVTFSTRFRQRKWGVGGGGGLRCMPTSTWKHEPRGAVNEELIYITRRQIDRLHICSFVLLPQAKSLLLFFCWPRKGRGSRFIGTL